jgi:multidrug efflux system outer membrane protein
MEAQRSLYATQQAAVSVQAQHVQSLVNLFKVLGGGWTAK